MRWGLRSLVAGRRRPPGDSSAPLSAPPADWRRLPPLTPTIAPRPALVGATLLGQPEISGTRSLIKRGPAGPVTGDWSGDPASGRVAGIVVPSTSPAPADQAGKPDRPRRPGAGTGPGPAAADPAPAGGLAPLPPARRRTALLAADPGARPNLVEATDDYLGDPQTDDVPYASSAWLRMVQAYRPLPVEPAPGGPFLPGLTETPKPDGGTVTSWSSEVPFPPPPRATSTPAAAVPQATGGDQPQRHRRATLAESRRLGIGRPLSKESPTAESEGTAPPTAGEPGPPYPPAGSMPLISPAVAIDQVAEPSAAGLDSFGPADPAQPLPAQPPPAQAPPAPPSAVTVDPVAIRRVPSGLGLGPPTTLRGVARDEGAPVTREGRAPGPPRPRQSADRPSPAPAAAPSTPAPPKPAPSKPEQPLPALPTAPPASPPWLPPPARRTEPGTEAEPARAAEPLAPPAAQHQPPPAAAAEPAPAPGVVVTPVYRAARPAPSRAAPAARPAASAAPPEPLIHREPPPPAARPEPDQELPSAAAPPSPPPAPPEPAPPPQPPAPVTPPLPAVPPGLPFLPPDHGYEAEKLRAPYDLADTIHRLHGIDVSDVVVSRGPEATARAESMGARAFATEHEVVLPERAGPLERPENRALLAHELTHIAQQRAFGPTLPPEDSAAGAVLEDAAIAVERRLLGGEHGGYGPVTFTAPPLGQGPVGQAPLVHAPPRPAATSAAEPAGAPVQRQTEHPAGADQAGSASDPFGLLPQLGATLPDVAFGYGPVSVPVGQVSPEVVPPDGPLEPVRARLIELAEQRLLDLDDPDAVEELAEGIYSQICRRLRRELLVDRERSGLLSDFR